jgi:SAM-dependent methyltransferase
MKNLKSKRATDLLIRTVLQKYGQKEEIEEFSRLTKSGLKKPEEKLAEKYFPPHASILSIGCGTGREALGLMGKKFAVQGIDLHPDMIQEAQKNKILSGSSANFLLMDACQLGFKNARFDAVVIWGCSITYVPGKKNRIRILEEVKRVLKPDGVLILDTQSRNSRWKYRIYFFVVNPWRKFLKKLFNLGRLEPGDRFGQKVSAAESKGKVFFHMYSMKEMIDDIHTAGLKVVECRSREELEKDVETPELREKDYFIYYVVRKAEGVFSPPHE